MSSTFTGFPLYSTILKDISNTDSVTTTIKSYVTKTFKRVLDVKDVEYIYALIISYYLDSEGENCKEIPYNGKISKKDVKFNIDDFPDKLILVIYKFLEKYYCQNTLKADNKNKSKGLIRKKQEE